METEAFKEKEQSYRNNVERVYRNTLDDGKGRALKFVRNGLYILGFPAVLPGVYSMANGKVKEGIAEICLGLTPILAGYIIGSYRELRAASKSAEYVLDEMNSMIKESTDSIRETLRETGMVVDEKTITVYPVSKLKELSDVVAD